MLKIVCWHLRRVPIITEKTAINSLSADDRIYNVNTNSQDGASSDEFNLCHVAFQITIPVYSQAAVSVSCQGAVLMTTEIHYSVAKR